MKADLGPPEAQLKRLAMVLNPKTGQIGDMKYAESSIGSMCELGFLHPDIAQARRMADAGLTFLQLYRAVFPEKCACTLARFQPSSNGEIDHQRASDDLRSIRAHLKEKRLYDVLIDSCVYDKWPKRRHRERDFDFIDLRTALMRIMEWQRSR